MSTIYEYLLHQTADDMEELYRSPWCCLAVFQSLDALAKQLVMRLLTMKGFVSRSFIDTWMRPGEGSMIALRTSLEKLIALSILGANDYPEEKVKALTMAGVAETIRGGDALAMLPTFRESLQSALTTETDVPWQTETGGLPLLVAPPPLAEVENYAASRWNAILHYLVGSPDAPEPDPQMIELLVSTRLLAPGKASDALLLDAEDAGPAASPTSSKPSSSPTAGPGAGAGAGAGASSSSSGAVGAADGAAAVAAATSGQRKRMTFAEIVSSGGGNVFITRAGYEFLLRDTSVQLWTFINEYLRTATSRGMKVTDILAFLFELGLCRLGDGYAVRGLTDPQRLLLRDFASFGLVYFPPDQGVRATPEVRAARKAAKAAGDSRLAEFRRFFPTSLAIVLTQPETTSATIDDALRGSFALSAASSAVLDSAVATADAAAGAAATAGGAGAGAGGGAGGVNPELLRPPSEAGKLYVVVEKNYRVYAYTNVDLHLALIALFAKVELRLPNLIVATLTRRSVITAMEKGITAEAIFHFLGVRAHPAVTSRGPAVPENVVDQLFLWERERHRVVFRPGMLVHGFDSQEAFATAEAHARDELRSLLWSDASTRELCVADGGFEAFRRFLAAQRSATGAGADAAGMGTRRSA